MSTIDETIPAAEAPRPAKAPPVRKGVLSGGSLVPDAPSPAQDRSPVQERRFLVGQDIQVPRPGGTYMLRAGKVISEKHYDVEYLRSIGAQLTEQK